MFPTLLVTCPKTRVHASFNITAAMLAIYIWRVTEAAATYRLCTCSVLPASVCGGSHPACGVRLLVLLGVRGLC